MDLAALLGVDEDLVPEELDGVAGPIQIDTGFPFGDTNQTQFYVSIVANDLILIELYLYHQGGDERDHIIWKLILQSIL